MRAVGAFTEACHRRRMSTLPQHGIPVHVTTVPDSLLAAMSAGKTRTTVAAARAPVRCAGHLLEVTPRVRRGALAQRHTATYPRMESSLPIRAEVSP